MTPMTTIETPQLDGPIGPSNLGIRLRHAADTYEEHREAARIAKERRDELIVAGYEQEAMSHAQLAHYARISRPRIVAILGEN